MTDRSDFSLRDLRERARPMSLYLSIPFGDQERVRSWTRLVLRQLLDYAVHQKEGWPWKLLCMIDEVPGPEAAQPAHRWAELFCRVWGAVGPHHAKPGGAD